MGIAHSVDMVDPARGIAPLLGVGSLVNYSFPTTAESGMDAPWSCDVENVGTDGRIAFGIVNDSGSPGNLVVGWKGEETILAPGFYFRVFTIEPVPKGYHLIENGTVRFEAVGTYAVRLWAMHEDAGKWYYDEEVLLNPPVTQSWPVTIQEPAFIGEKLEPKWGLVAKKTVEKRVDTAVFLGGRVDYSMTHLSATLPGYDAIILWNGVQKAVERPASHPGIPQIGSFNLTPLDIKAVNELTIKMTQGPAGFNVCTFDVYVTLGYSAEPDIDDPWSADWMDWLDQNKWLIGGGAIALTAVVLLTRRQTPFIIVTQAPGGR